MNKFLDELTFPGLLLLFLGCNVIGGIAAAVAEGLSGNVSVSENRNDVTISPDNVVLMPFKVDVQGCSDSEGQLDFFFKYERTSGDEKTVKEVASWSRRDTSAPIIIKGRVDLGDGEEFIDYNYDQILHFNCWD